MNDIEAVIDNFAEMVAEEADDTSKYSQEESAEIFEGVADVCAMRAQAIREEMEAD